MTPQEAHALARARDPRYIAFLETYTYDHYRADYKIGPIEAWRYEMLRIERVDREGH